MTGLPEASALFEAHLTVADLAVSTAFYRDVVGLPVALELPERGATFLWVGRPGRSMLGLWSIGSAPLGLRLHVALRTTLDGVRAAPAALRAAGITPRSFFGEETDEPSVIGWMPAAAVYFDDPDGHSIEYLAMLDAPPQPEAGIVSWSQWDPPEPVQIERHEGDRAPLRWLFEEAEDSAAALDAYIDRGDVLVARDAGVAVGHVQLVRDDDGTWEIQSLAVAPAQRGRGVGRALVEAAIAAAADGGARRVVVATAAADVGNLRFYQRCGFRLRDIQRDAFTPEHGYAEGIVLDGIPLRDRVRFDRDLR